MTVDKATAFLKKMEDDHDSPVSVFVAHGAALGHEFSEEDLLEASGGSSVTSQFKSMIKKYTSYKI